MKFLKERTEIAKAINGREIPVITIDLVNADEFGIVSEPVVIDNGTFDDGFPYMINAELRCYSDEREFKFKQGCTCIHSNFGYYDVEEMLQFRNAPVVKKDSDIIVVVKDSKEKKCWIMLMHTGNRIDAHCSTPLTVIDGNTIANDIFIEGARKYIKDGKYLGED